MLGLRRSGPAQNGPLSDPALPQQWREAYRRDRMAEGFSADPAPERRASRALAAFIMTGLGFMTFPGTLLGVWNLLRISSHQAGAAAATTWIQAHGQAQLFGWVGSFIFGISLYLLPKFQHRTLKNFGAVWTVWAMWTLGVSLRWWAGVSVPGWRPGLVLSSLLEISAWALAIWILAFQGKRRAGQPPRKLPRDFGSWVSMAGFAALGIALVLNFSISVTLARRGSLPAYPPASDRMFLDLALWGFAIPVAWGYSSRLVTIFLGLKQPQHKAAVWVALGVASLSVSALTKHFVAADLVAAATAVVAIASLRIFERPAPPPKLLGVYRAYPAFIRLSYAWLLAGALLGVAADVWVKQTGLTGASRHALTVGFLATLIFAVAPRLLPSFLGGRELFSPRIEALSLWLLTLGCLMRVSSESVAYSSRGWAWSLLPVSGVLELTAVILFGLNMALTVRAPVPAWLDPGDVHARLPLHWTVTMYPETRKILVGAGLKTLGRIEKPPRTLTLEEAATADRADAAALVEALRQFFAARQPRHSRPPSVPYSSAAV